MFVHIRFFYSTPLYSTPLHSTLLYPTYLSAYLPICLSTYLCLSVYLSIDRSICLSVCVCSYATDGRVTLQAHMESVVSPACQPFFEQNKSTALSQNS
jgi:hypothetical protein